MYKGKIPFTREGRLMNYVHEYSSMHKPHEWRDNHEFQATLTFQGFERGRSAAHGIFRDEEGQRFVIFLKDVDKLITSGALRTGGIASGTWCYCKRGTNYGVQPVKLDMPEPPKPWVWDRDAKDHWTAHVPGAELTMTVWGGLGAHEPEPIPGGWTWEVWGPDPANPDEPDFTGKVGSFEAAQAAAEQCLKENSWG